MVEQDIIMLCEWKGSEISAMNVQLNHVHIVVSIPPDQSMALENWKDIYKRFH